MEASKFNTTNSGLDVDRGYVGHKSAKMMKRSKAIAQRQERAIEEKKMLLQDAEKAETLKLFPLTFRTEKLAELRSVQILYDEPIGSPISFEILRGERIALFGGNGCGKTSLLKLLIGDNLTYEGQFRKATGLKISYIPQNSSFLSGPLDAYAEQVGIDRTQFQTILRKMDFSRDQMTRDMADFSAGQKKKVLIARSLCEQAHLYVWDEPLNYIDLYSRIQIEELIQRFSPTMIFVEHDAKFMENIATKVIEL